MDFIDSPSREDEQENEENFSALQFYPTPLSLAYKVWAMFKNQEFTRVLDACAGRGDLAAPADSYKARHIDCIEIDIAHHAFLTEKDFTVVGFDFMDSVSNLGAQYSHIIMNPPFAHGASMLLKAWGILWNGEIGAILNAETLRNPYTKERQHLARLIERHGTVEFVKEAFMDPDTQRKTMVEVALVHMTKVADTAHIDLVSNIVDGLVVDSEPVDAQFADFQVKQELALPGQYITNAVRTFNAAVAAAKTAEIADMQANYYEALLGAQMAARLGGGDDSPARVNKEQMQKKFGKRYQGLKNRAWASILSSVDVMKKLSSAGQSQVNAEFETIKKLAFTESNIRGFLVGLCENQGAIQENMALDVFDTITRYHYGNQVYYRGWKSNNKHRTCGKRIKTTRFILPHHPISYGKCLGYESLRLLADFDKVFAMVDGKSEPDISLVSIFETQMDALLAGQRVSGTYFDVRYYAGIGTIHFFGRDAKTIDRLNRFVGRVRRWLPPSDDQVGTGFWAQYNDAEKMAADYGKEGKMNFVSRGNWRGWEHELESGDADVLERSHSKLDRAMASVQAARGIDADLLIGDSDPVNQPLLLAV